jgi:hypothetical protein
MFGRVYPDAFPVYPKYVKSECIPEMMYPGCTAATAGKVSACIRDTQKRALASVLPAHARHKIPYGSHS